MSSSTTSPPLLMDPYSQAPPLQISQQEYTAHSVHGSVGPVIGVLAVITILGAIAVMVGRLCSGRRLMGRAQYDFEGWMENKCASCIDGRVDLPPPRMLVDNGESTVAAAPPPEERDEEAREEEVPGVNIHQHERDVQS